MGDIGSLEHADPYYIIAGKVNFKRLPLPGSLSPPISPSIAATCLHETLAELDAALAYLAGP
jgi:hypothetical protein